MNTPLPSPTTSLHVLNPATFVNYAVSAHISTSKQPAPMPPRSTVHSKLDYSNSLYLPNSQTVRRSDGQMKKRHQ